MVSKRYFRGIVVCSKSIKWHMEGIYLQGYTKGVVNDSFNSIN